MAAASTPPPTELKRLCAGTHVHVLDNDEVVIDGVRFLGTTLWTDFMLFGDGDASERLRSQEAQRLMRDFSRIRIGDAAGALFTPDDSAALFERNAEWLDRRLDTPHAGTDGRRSPITHRRAGASTRGSPARC